jgi:hypothetical protein
MCSLGAFSQEILLEQNVKADTVRATRGPNLRHFVHGYVGVGFPIFTNEEVNYTKFGTSSAVELGVRYKRRLTQTFALGLNLGVNLAAFKIKQDEGKFVPDYTRNDKEKFQINSLAGPGYVRINVGRRGNYIGNYLDLCAFSGWNFIKKHKTTNENQQGEKVRVLTSKLNYMENFSYGVLARLGTGRYALTASYRLSDIFKSSYSMPELPRLILGFEVGLFK